MSQNLVSEVENTLLYSQSQIDKTLATNIEYSSFPHRNYEGSKWDGVYYRDWTSGFWPGCLWLMYECTQDSVYLPYAKGWTNALEEVKNNNSTHDIGFQVMCTYGNGLRITEAEAYEPIIIQAAKTLSSRFNEKIGCIVSWESASWNQCNKPVIIDNMMNLELLYKATELSGDSSFYEQAVSHGLKSIEVHQSENGTFHHIADFDNDGNLIYLGMSKSWPDTISHRAWSRGQGWALYGFAMSYRFSKRPEFLNAAEKLADYLIDSITPGFVPRYIMKHETDPNYDASAAAIMFSGLMELFEISEKQEYLTLAENIFSALSTEPFITIDKDFYSILSLCAENYADRQKGLIYADYYFIEGMLRYLELFSKPATELPVVETYEIKSIRTTFATAGGILTSNGGADSIETGICWDTIPNPDLEQGFVLKTDSATNVFSFTLSDLKPQTSYYLRAFAKNSTGIAYGQEISFTTKITTRINDNDDIGHIRISNHGIWSDVPRAVSLQVISLKGILIYHQKHQSLHAGINPLNSIVSCKTDGYYILKVTSSTGESLRQLIYLDER